MTTVLSDGARINDKDKRLTSVAEVRDFSGRLTKTLGFAEEAEMRLGRLERADSVEDLGGWPEGFVFSTDAFAACQLLADDLSSEAERMQEWAAKLRSDSAYLWWTRGPGSKETS